MKNKKPIVLILLTILLSLALLPLLVGCNSNKAIVLKVYNAQDYIQHVENGDSVLKDFEEYYKQKTGVKIKVQYDTFDTLERAYTIINKRKADYDVFCPSDYIIEKMKKNDLLNPLDLGKIPNISNIAPFLLDRDFDKGNQYSVPYMWGTVGILYNADKVAKEDLNGWELLWNEKYKNKILMKDSIRDSVFIATIYAYRDELKRLAEDSTTTPEKYRERLSELVNNMSDDVLQTVEKELRKQYNILYAYEVDSGKDSIVNGEALINLAWSGDAVWAIDEAAKNGIRLDYYVPEEGSNVWFDNWVIPKFAKNPDIAHEFINYMCRPDIAQRNSEEIGYTTAVISPEIIEDMIMEQIEVSNGQPIPVEAKDFTYLFKGKDGKITENGQKLLDACLKAGLDITSLHIREVSLPSSEKADVCVEMTDFGDLQDTVVKMWTRVKALPLGVEVIIFSVCLAIAIASAIAFSIYKKVEKKKQVANKIEQISDGTAIAQKSNRFAIFATFKTKAVEFWNKLFKKDKK